MYRNRTRSGTSSQHSLVADSSETDEETLGTNDTSDASDSSESSVTDDLETVEEDEEGEDEGEDKGEDEGEVEREDDGEEEEAYVPADLQDVMHQGEIGETVEAEEVGETNEDEEVYRATIDSLRRAVVSESSQNAYNSAMLNMINWLSLHQAGSGFSVVSTSWVEGLSSIGDNERARKAWIKSKLQESDVNNPPLMFDSFKPGKFIVVFAIILTLKSLLTYF